jgi:hypothetical protein
MKKDIHKQKKPEDKKVKYLIQNLVLTGWLIIAGAAEIAFALEPRQILIIANSDVNESLLLADYYCNKRNVPVDNILKIPLGANLAYTISRQDYNNILASAVKNALAKNEKSNPIKCLLTLYAVPLKVGPAEPLPSSQLIIPKLTPILNAKEKKFKNILYQLNQLGRKELIDRSPAQSESYEDIVRHLAENIKQTVKRIEYIEQQDVRKKQQEKLVIFLKSLYGPVYAQQQIRQFPQIPFTISKIE